MFRSICKRLFCVLGRILEYLVAFPYEPKILNTRRSCPAITEDILLKPAASLVDDIINCKVSSEYVVQCYINRVKTVNPIINAVVEDNFSEALRIAKRTDHFISTTQLKLEELKMKYPLLGVPFSVKESIAVAGLSHNAGRMFKNRPSAAKNADAVQMCVDAGGIPLLVSNTPEMCACSETFNKVTGITSNPYDTRRTCGGSSGGEGAILSSAGSVIGLGSDLCGSIRLPACLCGVWGHKPSETIVSIKGHLPYSFDKCFEYVFAMGPMTRYATDLRLMMNVIAKPEKKHLLKLHERVPLSKIKLYYMEDNGGSILTHKVDEEIVDAMRKIVAHMDSIGVQTKKLNSKQIKLSPKHVVQYIFDAFTVEEVFEGSFKSMIFELFKCLIGIPKYLIVCLVYALSKEIASMLPKSIFKNTHIKVFDYKQKLVETLGNNGVLLFPCYPVAAPRHKKTFGWIMDTTFTGGFNCIGFPATSCPMGLNCEGLPIGIQVISTPYNDRLNLEIAEEIEHVFGGWVDPSSPMVNGKNEANERNEVNGTTERNEVNGKTKRNEVNGKTERNEVNGKTERNEINGKTKRNEVNGKTERNG